MADGGCDAVLYRIVRTQGLKAIDMFIKRTEVLTANMPDTVLSPEEQQQPGPAGNTSVASSRGQPGVAESAGGAAVALAGWAFTSLSSRLGSADLQAGPMQERRGSSPAPSTVALEQATSRLALGGPSGSGGMNGATGKPALSQSRTGSQSDIHANGHSGGRSSLSQTTLPGGFSSTRSSLSAQDFGASESASGDWGGDLMDVAADEGDFDEFESAALAAPPEPAAPIVHPRFTITKKATPVKAKPLGAGSGTQKGKMSLGARGGLGAAGGTGAGSAAAAAVLAQIEAEEGSGDWSFDAAGAGAGAGADGVRDEDDWGMAEVNASAQPDMTIAANASPLVSPTSPSSRTASPAPAPSPAPGSAPVPAAGATSGSMGKDKLAQMREERKARLAAAKEKKAAAGLGAKKL